MEQRGDLHLHSLYSDASSTPENLVRYAKSMGLSFLAVTDHDTMAGVPRAVKMGEQLGIPVIPGVEWSCCDGQRENRKVHLLAYFLKETPPIRDLSREILRSRGEANWTSFRKLSDLYPVTEEMLSPIIGESTVLYKQHMLKLLVDMGFTDKIFSPLYDQLFSSKGGSCFVASSYPDIRQVIPLVREAGGVCVVAHSMAYHNFPLVEELAQKGMIQGVEVWHPNHSAQDRQQLLDFARKMGLAATGGTDFHGMHRERSQVIGTCFTTQEDFSALTAKKEEKTQQNPLV